ncbi:hypothetical protein CIW83_18120 [Tissierella sp. P1]|uniref:BglII/BstYI family type II restriction endonuclease n=1 Tax=Tissierella sp. P1 TaxID=1280483 RepID=UPI000BA05CD7|nr:BglII/BstYI family type II restriction endonuclease [Tissierella sp. P1]OZV10842.1 hypothetical protein CIW83_18120 [Tissierella sp. P1]
MKTKIISKNFGEYSVPESIVNSLIDHLQSSELDYNIHSSSDIRNIIDSYLSINGWALNSKVHERSKISITASKSKIGLCVQTGNISRYYADILKLETLFKKDRIHCGIIILPSKKSSLKLGNNVVNCDRVSEEIDIFKHTITIPLILISIE